MVKDKDEFTEATIGCLGRPIAFQMPFARVGGSAAAGLFLSQLYYWTGKGRLGEWVYKTQQEWRDETFLTPSEQKTARGALRALGVLIESTYSDLARELKLSDKYASFDRTACFRINFEALKKCLCSQIGSQIPVAIDAQEISDRSADFASPKPEKSLTGLSEIAVHCTQTTSKTTTTCLGGGVEKQKNEIPAATANTVGAGEKTRKEKPAGALAEFLSAARQPAVLLDRVADLAMDLGSASKEDARRAGAAWAATALGGKLCGDGVGLARALCRKAREGDLLKAVSEEMKEEIEKERELNARRAKIAGQIFAAGSGRRYEARGAIAVALDGGGNHRIDADFFAAIAAGKLVLEDQEAV